MFCNNCGSQLPDGSKFCNVCGSAVGGAQQIQYGAQQAQAGAQQNVQMNAGQPYQQNTQMNGQQPYSQQRPMGGAQPNQMQGQQYAQQRQPYPQGQPYPQQRPMGGAQPNQMYGRQPYPQQRPMGGGQPYPQPGKQGGSKTKLIIGIIIGVVLIAGGILTWVLLSKDKDKDKAKADNRSEGEQLTNNVYVGESEKNEDVQVARTIGTALSAALAVEDCYYEIMEYIGSASGDVIVLVVEPNEIGEELSLDNIKTGEGVDREVYANLGGSNGKCYLKYTQNGASYYVVTCNKTGEVKVYISKTRDSLDWQVYPEIDPEYK